MVVGFVLAAVAAVSKTAQNILSKKLSEDSSSLLTAWSIRFFAAAITLPIFLIGGNPVFTFPLIFPIYALLGILLTSFSTYAVVKGFEEGDISFVTPLMAFTPVFALIAEFLLLDKIPSFIGLGGVFLTVVGAYILNVKGSISDLLYPIKRLVIDKGSRFMLLGAAGFGILSSIDKTGIKFVPVQQWLLITYTGSAIILGAIITLTSPENWVKLNSRKELSSHFLLGAVGLLMIMAQLEAFKHLLTSYFLSIKMTSILLTVVLGWRLFEEELTKTKVVGTILLFAGIILIVTA
jgi:drug/metabolite transporter (DMT)-like permease